MKERNSVSTLPRDPAARRRIYRRRRIVAACTLCLIVAAIVFCAARVHDFFSSRAHASQAAAQSSQTAGTQGADAADAADPSGTDATAVDSADRAASASASPSPTETDLTASLGDDLDGIFAGADYAVSVTDLKTGTPLVSISTDEQFTAASTYKLYVAYSMISAVESGRATWNSSLNGTTLSACFSTMIVDSDNDCPVAWLERYGFDSVNEEVQAAGFTGTNIEDSNMLTTASDLTDYLTRLYGGTLYSDGSRQRLLECMETQIYRSGIPAGIGENGTVADKVGFLDGLLHDAAIVYSDKGDYSMVILTDGSSWDAIAEAASTIYDAL